MSEVMYIDEYTAWTGIFWLLFLGFLYFKRRKKRMSSNEKKSIKKTPREIAGRRFSNFIIGIIYPGHRIYKISDVSNSFDQESHYKNLHKNISEKVVKEIVFYEQKAKESPRGIFSQDNKDENIALMLRGIINAY